MATLSDPERLAALERSGLLRHGQDERLVRICYTVTELLQVDASQVNIITDRAQHTVAEWPRAAPAVAEFSNSGCWTVVEAEGTTAIENTLEHPILCRMPWTATWQGYLGTPITYEGQHLGALCALSVSKRKWTLHDRMGLESLADLVLESIRVDRDAPTP